LAGWLVGWLAGQYSPWLVGWLVGLLAGITCRPGWLVGWLAGQYSPWLVGWLACGFVGWDHLQASKFKEAQEIQQVDELHQAIKRQKINDAVAALEAKWDAVDSACTIPMAKKSLKKQISNDSEGYPVLRSEATQLT
jgi:hypothetical protein